MKNCGILDALKYIEDLHSQIPKEDWKGKAAVGKLFYEFNKDRVELQRAAGFAGAKPLTVYNSAKPAVFEPVQTAVKTSESVAPEPVRTDNPTALENIDNGELSAIIEAYSKKCEG